MEKNSSNVIRDGYVYESKACSDIAIVFLASCKALGIEGNLLKLISLNKKQTHIIVEVKLNRVWYRLDPSFENSIPHPKKMTGEDIFRKKYKLWKRGKDNWDIGLDSYSSMEKVFGNNSI